MIRSHLIWFCSESVGTTRTPSCCPVPSDDAEGRLCNSIPTWSGASWLRKKKVQDSALNTILYNAFLSGIFWHILGNAFYCILLLGMRPNAMQRSKSQGCDLLLVPFQIPWNYFVEWCHDMVLDIAPECCRDIESRIIGKHMKTP